MGAARPCATAHRVVRQGVAVVQPVVVPPPARVPRDASLDDLRTEFARRGWRADLVGRSGGEVGRRLVIGLRPGFVVELLGPLDDTLESPQWVAVRMKSGRRTVWGGPARPSPSYPVVRFVEDLLCRTLEDLPGRYDRVG